MKKNNFKIKPIQAAVIGATLLVSNGTALATPVSTTLEFSCPFPIIGDQIITAQISADIPSVIDVTKTNAVGPIHITTVNIIPDKGRIGLGLVDATLITGKATAINSIHAVSDVRPLIAELTIKPTGVPTVAGPFEVPADGDTPIVTVDETHIGPVSINVDDLVLDLVNYKENGDVAPAPIGEFQADCTLAEGQNNTLVTIEVVGDNPPPPKDPADIAINVTSLDFGIIKMGEPAVTKTITIANEGDLTLGINNISLSGAGSASFIESNFCTTLSGNESCTVDVTYTASDEGTQRAELVIDSSDEDPEETIISIPLTGTTQIDLPGDIEVNPTSIDFGKMTVGALKTETITISNIGGEALNILEISVNGDEFVNTDENCATLAAKSSCITEVTYTAIEGTSTGSVTIYSDEVDEPTITIPLTGSGEDNSITFELGYNLAGDTYIAASKTTVLLNGDIEAEYNGINGDLAGSMTLNPSSGKFEIIQGWKKYLATAQIEFEAVKGIKGALIDGKLVATTSAYIKLPKITKTLFGWVNWKIGGGKNCRTSEPATFNISTINGDRFEPLTGGNIVGTYSLPKFENCGPLTDILNLKMMGSGNKINLKLLASAYP